MLKRKVKIENKSKHLLIIMSAFLFFIAISLLVFKYYGLYEKDKQEQNSIELFFEEIPTEKEESEPNLEKVEEKENIIQYVAVLEIPKINLKKGLVDKNSKANNVDRNIYTLKESTFPDEEEESHVILASHSGSGYYSYFNKLNKLKNNDQVFLYYQGIKYIYQIVNIYEVKKTGTVSLRQTTGSDITLITCISGTDKQIVYVGSLEAKENY